MKRKALAILLSLVLVLASGSTAFAAGDDSEDTTPKFTVGSAQASPGETVILPVTLTNNPGALLFSGAYFHVLQNGEEAGEDCGVSIVTSFVDVAAYNEENGTNYSYENGLFETTDRPTYCVFNNEKFNYWARRTTFDGDGVVFYIAVEIATTAQAGEYEIALSKLNNSALLQNSSGSYDATLINGTLTVTDGEGGDQPADPVDSPYTVSLEPSKDEVALGEMVDVDVVVKGAAFNAYDITVTYDPALFTYGDDTTGSVTIADYGKNFTSGDTVKTLTFTAKNSLSATNTGEFGITKAKIAVSGVALEAKDAYPAATEGASVDILLKYAVTFLDQDGNVIQTVTVTEGRQVTAADIPDAPDLAHYTFNGWSNGIDEDLLYADDIAGLAVTAPVTYTAVYTADTYAVDFDSAEINAATTATYGTDYTGTVAGYDGNYAYTVTAVFDGGSSQDYAVNEDGFTIPGTDVTGNMTLTVNKVINGVNVAVYGDYVGGYSLVVAYGTAGGYSYNGNAMYRTAYYDGDDANTDGRTAYAYIVKGAVSEADAFAALAATNSAEEITDSYNVNASANVDIADVQAVADCYNIQGELAKDMPVYLRADVNASHQVDTTDANLVLENRT